MKLRHILCSLCILMLTAPAALADESDDFGVWADVQVNKDLGKYYAKLRIEHRSMDNAASHDALIIRPTFGVKALPWLDVDLSYDYIVEQACHKHRGLLSVTGKLKQGDLSVSVRERYVYAWTIETKSSSHVLRSQLKAQYSIPDSIVRPYLAIEMFTWTKWNKTRHYVGTELKFNPHHSLDLFYMYYTFDGKPSRHLAGLGYNFSF